MRVIFICILIGISGCTTLKPAVDLTPGTYAVFTANKTKMIDLVNKGTPGARAAYDDMVKQGCFKAGATCGETLSVKTLP